MRVLPSLAMASVLFFAAGAGAQTRSPYDPAPRGTEEVAAYNDIVARSFFIEVEPLVEKHTGWECEWPVSFRLVSREQFVEIAMEDLRGNLGREYAHLSPKSVEAMLKPALQSQSAGLLGLFSATSKSILLLPGNLKPTMRSLGVEARFSRDVLEVILAHELTHAVQEKHENITQRRASMPTEEMAEAWTMMVEGHASWVADRVALDLKLDEAVASLAAGMTQSLVTGRTVRSRAGASANVQGYTKGKDFVAAVFKRGGLPAVQKLFKKPPINATQVGEPGLYFRMLEQ